jgi:hypothetical protein
MATGGRPFRRSIRSWSAAEMLIARDSRVAELCGEQHEPQRTPRTRRNQWTAEDTAGAEGSLTGTGALATSRGL